MKRFQLICEAIVRLIRVRTFSLAACNWKSILAAEMNAVNTEMQ